MRFRKRPRRNLRICGNSGEQQERNQRKPYCGEQFRLPNKQPSQRKSAPRRRAWQVHELGSHSGAVRPARPGWDENNMRPELLHGANCCPCSVCYRRFFRGRLAAALEALSQLCDQTGFQPAVRFQLPRSPLRRELIHGLAESVEFRADRKTRITAG